MKDKNEALFLKKAAWTRFLNYLFHSLNVHVTIAKLSKAHESFLENPNNGSGRK